MVEIISLGSGKLISNVFADLQSQYIYSRVQSTQTGLSKIEKLIPAIFKHDPRTKVILKRKIFFLERQHTRNSIVILITKFNPINQFYLHFLR